MLDSKTEINSQINTNMKTQNKNPLFNDLENLEKKCKQPGYAPDKDDMLAMIVITWGVYATLQEMGLQFNISLERITLLAKENEKLRDELDRAKNLGFK